MHSSSDTFWKDRKVLLTGHTGFTGMWVSFWLARLGARVTGLSLRPATTPSFHGLVNPWPGSTEHFADLRHVQEVDHVVQAADPEVILHLAAQPLVGVSIEDPVTTFATNVQGTAHLLSSVKRLARPRVILIITSDKVYANRERGIPFREGDLLGGDDPYSASKACVELMVHAWRESFLAGSSCRLATARLGNVIGGGDWARDRLVPDYFRAVASGRPFHLRSPRSVRPWQHVLDVIAGYLRYAERLASGEDLPLALNFGPTQEGVVTTEEVIELLQRAIGRPIPIEKPVAPVESFAEKRSLSLDARLAMTSLSWRPRFSLEDTARWTAEWYGAWLEGRDMARFTLGQIESYVGSTGEAVGPERPPGLQPPG